MEQKLHLRKSSTVINNFIDFETGEIIESNTNGNTILVGSEEEFYLMYASLVINFLAASNDPAVKLFSGLIKRYSAGQEFELSGYLKGVIAEETNGNVKSFNNAVTKLKRLKAITEIVPKIYKINPRFIFKGSSSQRKKNLMAILEFCPDC